MRHLFTSESVSEGHPDKISDLISDTVVDLMISKDPYSRVACETLVTTNKVVIAGEYRLDIDKSTAEFNNIEFLSDQVDFKDSEIIIRKSVFYFNHSHYMASSRQHPSSIWESSTVDIYDSTIYRDKEFK